MQVGVIGINSFSCPLIGLREKIFKIFSHLFSQSLSQVQASYVLVSTCNRSELYFSASCLSDTHTEILQLLREKIHEPFEGALYSYFGKECFLHLGRVICGMDSLIFGESDVQRQVKVAYETSRHLRKLSSSLHYLFQKGLKIGKEMRSNVFSSHCCLPEAVFMVLKRFQDKKVKKSVLFVGNSMINRTMASFFMKKGGHDLYMTTRNPNKKFSNLKICHWEICDRWMEFDVVIAATYHEGYILKSSQNLKDLKRHIVLFDLGMPRNIDPLLHYHPLIHLFNLHTLSQIANDHQKIEDKKIQFCETRIKRVIDKQMDLFYKKQTSRWRYASSCDKLAFLP